MDTVRRFANLDAPQQVRSLAGEQEPSGIMPEASLRCYNASLCIF